MQNKHCHRVTTQLQFINIIIIIIIITIIKLLYEMSSDLTHSPELTRTNNRLPILKLHKMAITTWQIQFILQRPIS